MRPSTLPIKSQCIAMHYYKSKWMRLMGVQNHYFEAVSFNEERRVHWYWLLKTGEGMCSGKNWEDSKATPWCAFCQTDRIPQGLQASEMKSSFLSQLRHRQSCFQRQLGGSPAPGLTVLGCDTTYCTSETPASLPHTTTSHLNKAPGQVSSLTFIVHLTTCSTDKVKLIHVFFKCVMAL